jgi:hypothetical protein
MYQARRSATLIFAAVAAVGATVLTAISAAAVTQPAGAARAAAPLSGWGTAQELPTTALNQGDGAYIESLSCASAGNCGAGGAYYLTPNNTLAFVVSETNGTWGSPEELPGIAALDPTEGLYNIFVSCPSAGNCSAGGSYTVGTGDSARQEMFVDSETDGTWHSAEEVPGSATLNQGGSAHLQSLSCASAGNCAAGGQYKNGSGHLQAFVVSETNGTWQKAEEVRGIATLNQSNLEAVSCAAAGNCVAGGSYSPAVNQGQAFVVSETNGTWQKAQELPGSTALNQGKNASIWEVSCSSAGNCSAGGDYSDASGNQQVLVASEVNGTWQKAQEAPGTAALNQGGVANVGSISCASAGNCTAGGAYFSRAGTNHEQVFVVSQVNGTWQKAQELPGIATLNRGGDPFGPFAVDESVSCSSAGNCAAGGLYTDGSGNEQAFVASQVNGTWQKAQEVPGTAALNVTGAGETWSVSCAAAGTCTAAGNYRDGSGHLQAFAVSN